MPEYSYIPLRKGSLLLFTGLLFILFLAKPCHAFQGGTHRYIAEQAIGMLNDTYDIGADFLETTTYQRITNWAVDADYNNWDNLLNQWRFESALAPLVHFWDADSNKGLLGFSTAYEKADEYWNLAITEYTKGNKSKAYEFLGATIHLLSDMGSPAHVHNDDHILGDFMENYLEQNHSWQGKGDRIPPYSNLHDFMYYLNQQTAWFPSNGPSQDGSPGNDLDGNGDHHPEWRIGPS
ncbi:MAG: hypothetical protein PHI31_03795 [Desulfuromonadaceae bacterium]|nr:hypothetical protein [Desulfuromonadaceae bacterium]